jgi:hypothetical protein
MILKKSVLSGIRNNKRLKIALTDYFNISHTTLYRWLDGNATSFTEYQSLVLIASYLGVDEVQDLIEPTEVTVR